MSLKKKTVRNLQFVGISQLLNASLLQIGYLVLARMLTPDDFGLYSAVMVIFNLSVAISTLGLTQAAIQSKNESDELLRTAATFRIVVAVSAIAVVLLVAPSIASFYNKPEMANPLQVMSIAIFVASAGFVPTVRLTKALRFKELSISRITGAITWPVVAIATAAIGLSYWSMILATIFGSAAAMGVLWAYAPWKLSLHIDKKILFDLLGFGKFPVAIGVAVFIFFNVDKVVVGRLLGADQLGVYFLAFTWGTMVPSIFTNIVNNVMFPTYVKVSNDRNLLSKGYLKTMSYLGYISLPMGFGLAAISSAFIPIALGAVWSDASTPLAVFSMVGICSALTSPAASLFLATGNPHLSWRQTIVTVTIFLILLVPAANLGGILGVSALMLTITLVSLIWVISMASKLIDVSIVDSFKSLWKPTSAAVMMAAIVYACSSLMSSSFLSLIALVSLGVVLYATIVYALNVKTFRQEVRSMADMLLNR